MSPSVPETETIIIFYWAWGGGIRTQELCKVEVDVLIRSLIVFAVFVDVKQHLKKKNAGSSFFDDVSLLELYTLYLLACQVRVTVGDFGPCQMLNGDIKVCCFPIATDHAPGSHMNVIESGSWLLLPCVLILFQLDMFYCNPTHDVSVCQLSLKSTPPFFSFFFFLTWIFTLCLIERNKHGYVTRVILLSLPEYNLSPGKEFALRIFERVWIFRLPSYARSNIA